MTCTDEIAAASVNTDTFEILRPDNSKVDGTVSYDVNAKSASFTPDNLWVSNAIYTVKLNTNIRDISGLLLAKKFTSKFATKSLAPSSKSASIANDVNISDINTDNFDARSTKN